MNKIKSFALLLALSTATACAPVVYDGTYRDYRRPSSHVSIQSSYVRPAYDYRRAYHHNYHPIEVTLYADNTYVGFHFEPIHLVFHDGDYIEIPLRGRKGQLSRMFAHYHLGELHFDRDRECHRILDMPRYRYDGSWEKGRKYGHFNAAKKYNLDGVSFEIRKHKKDRRAQINNNYHHRTKNYPDRKISKESVKHKNDIRGVSAKKKSRDVRERLTEASIIKKDRRDENNVKTLDHIKTKKDRIAKHKIRYENERQHKEQQKIKGENINKQKEPGEASSAQAVKNKDLTMRSNSAIKKKNMDTKERQTKIKHHINPKVNSKKSENEKHKHKKEEENEKREIANKQERHKPKMIKSPKGKNNDYTARIIQN